MKISRIQEPLILVFLFSLFGIVLFRATNLSLTTDEAFTYNFFVRASWWRVLFLDQSVSANNHFALTVILKLFITKLSNSEFFLRLPSIIAFGSTVVFFTYHRKKMNFSFALLFFAFAFSNHIAVDLFSLSRGYGISFCLLMVHFYYLGIFFKSENIKETNLNRATLILFFAVLFNLNLLHYSLAFFLLLLLLNWQNKPLGKKFIGRFIIENKSVFLFGFFIFPVYQLIKYKQLYFGGHTGILEDSIFSLIRNGWTPVEVFFPTSLERISILFVGVVLIALLCDFYSLVKEKKISKTNQLSILLIFCLVIEFLQHSLFGTPYLLDRSALVYWFLLAGIISSLIISFARFSKNWANFMSLFLSFCLMIITFCIPINYSPEWKQDADNREILPVIFSDSKSDFAPKITNDWYFEPGLNYYRLRQGFSDRIKEFERDEIDTTAFNYYVISAENLHNFERSRFTVLKHFPISNTYIIKQN